LQDCALIIFCLVHKIADRLVAADVDREVRGWEKTSDHAPTWIELADDMKKATTHKRRK
jgi:exodeoxyribonuclease-3